MATIPGSHFVVATPLGYAGVNIVETSTGTGIGGDTIPGDFNLEIYTGPAPAPTTPAPGYQGLGILTSGGAELILQSGAYAVTDNGTGNDTLAADGSYETISGGGANVTLTLGGINNVANGGGQDTISVLGAYDTVNGGGNDQVSVFGSFDAVNAGPGADTISIFGGFDTVSTGSGPDTVNVFGSFDTVEAGTGTTALVNLYGSFETIADGPNTYADTVVGFSQGDKIQLSGGDTAGYAVAHATSSGGNTLITLNDGSTILLKGISHIDPSFFS
jgi:Ca2+-binding RTX toxin-like protein